MACACKVNSDLIAINKKYGIKAPKEDTKKFEINWWQIGRAFINGVLVLILSPIFLIHILFTRLILRKNTINISALFGLK